MIRPRLRQAFLDQHLTGIAIIGKADPREFTAEFAFATGPLDRGAAAHLLPQPLAGPLASAPLFRAFGFPNFRGVEVESPPLYPTLPTGVAIDNEGRFTRRAIAARANGKGAWFSASVPGSFANPSGNTAPKALVLDSARSNHVAITSFCSILCVVELMGTL